MVRLCLRLLSSFSGLSAALSLNTQRACLVGITQSQFHLHSASGLNHQQIRCSPRLWSVWSSRPNAQWVPTKNWSTPSFVFAFRTHFYRKRVWDEPTSYPGPFSFFSLVVRRETLVDPGHVTIWLKKYCSGGGPFFLLPFAQFKQLLPYTNLSLRVIQSKRRLDEERQVIVWKYFKTVSL